MNAHAAGAWNGLGYYGTPPAWQNDKEARDSEMPGQWRAGIRSEGEQRDYIKSEVTRVEVLHSSSRTKLVK